MLGQLTPAVSGGTASINSTCCFVDGLGDVSSDGLEEGGTAIDAGHLRTEPE